MRTLVLWDIDGTLIATNGVTSDLFDRVFHDVVGRPVSEFRMWPGGTELGAFRLHAQRVGVTPDPGMFAAFAAALADAHRSPEAALGTRARALPGAHDALAALAARAGVVQTLLTGNTREIAKIKTDAFGLSPRIDFDAGAYGDDHAERPRLVPLARERAARRHGVFAAAETVVVGDTPRDVEAALTGGVRVVAVATGMSSAADLRAAGAHEVLDDLTDTGRVVAAVLGGCGR